MVPVKAWKIPDENAGINDINGQGGGMEGRTKETGSPNVEEKRA